MTFDGDNKIITLSTTTTSATEIWSRWNDWLASDTTNTKWLPALSQVGGDDLGGGLLIPYYVFLINGWRVRPMESDQLLVISGNLYVDGGGQPVVNTIGNYNVSVQYTVPVQAQGYSTTGGTSSGTSIDYNAISDNVWSYASRSLTVASGLTIEQNALLEQIASDSSITRKSITNKVSIFPQVDGDIIVVYDEDGVTPVFRTQVSKDKTQRIVLV
jgi:hypothetical protein